MWAAELCRRKHTWTHTAAKQREKGNIAPLTPISDYLSSCSLSLHQMEQGIVLSAYGGQFYLQIECTKSAYSWANSITKEGKGVWKSHKRLSPSNPPRLPMLNPPWCTGALSEPLRPTLAPRAHTHTAIQMLWVINLPLWASACVKVWETDFARAIESLPL